VKKSRAFFVVIIYSALLLSFFGQHVRVYHYLLDNEHFTQKYCMNRNQPESTCNGTCRIKKMASEHESNQPVPKPEIERIVLFIIPICPKLSCLYDFPFFRHFFHYGLNTRNAIKHEELPPPDVLWS
jgi:hypothetical protein